MKRTASAIWIALTGVAGSECLEVWKYLREGYDRFEKSRIPPEVALEDERYAFR
ncbi:MAG: hypothetical protein Q8Q59_02425 [Luteolibacter sp.]|nr:hypothetical protein [Luteolibacter sp.]